MCKHRGEASGVRDKVIFAGDERWILMELNRLRYRGGGKGEGGRGGGGQYGVNGNGKSGIVRGGGIFGGNGPNGGPAREDIIKL